jgi:archaellum component FlaC
MFNWLWKMTKTKDDRQFEALDERLIDIQGKLKNLTVGLKQQFLAVNQKLDGMVEQFPNLMLMKEEVSIIHKLVAAGVKDTDGSVLTAVNNLSGKVETMSSNIDRIEKEAADLTEDAGIIKQALTDLKTLVADLQTQVKQGQLDQARLDAAATSLEKVDDDLDSMTATPAPPTEG